MAFALTAAQRNIWLDQMTQGDSPLYNIGGYVEIDGYLDPDVFQRAVDLLIEKHDALRMVLLDQRDEEGVPLQTFAASMPMSVTALDLQGQDDTRQAAENWMQRQLERVFRLDGSPLVRMHLLKLETQRFYFVIHAHHIALDGWGIDGLCASLSQLYNALHDQRTPDLQAPSYIDFIKDDIQYRESSRFARDQSYWLNKYRDIPEPLLVPRPRQSQALFQVQEQAESQDESQAPSRSGHLSYGFPRALEQQIDDLALSLQASSFHVLLAVLYVYFTRTQQRDELVIGLPILNRSNASFKKTLGLFTQLSSVRLTFSVDLPFAELVKGICRAVKQDYRNQRFPVSDLNRLLELRRTERTQLFDLTFSYERHNHQLRFGQATARAFKSSNNHEQTPLAIHLRTNAYDTESRLHCIYNEAYFQRDEIAPLAERLQHVIRQGLANEQLPVHGFSLISDTETSQMQAWNARQPHFATDLTIHQEFEARAAQRPDAIALEYQEQRLSYGELNARANQVAHRLLAVGVRPDDRVAICVERGPAMIIGLLGILKSGAGYVPLDPAYPRERLAYILGDSSPVALLSQHSLQEALPVLDVPVISLDDADLHDESIGNPQVSGLTAASLAYVIYTSGSTGLPKGVMVEHRNVARLFSATEDWFGFGEQDVWALFHSFAFDFSVWEIWGALLHGGRLLIVPQLLSRSPEEFYTLLCSAGVTVLNQTPSAFRQLIAAQAENPRAHSLRQVIFGGEALETAMLKPWYARQVNAATQLVNMYGITETTVHVTYYPLQAEDARRVGASPIGKRIPDLQLYVLDAFGHPLPPGAVGELYIGGAGVARGYLNRDELNATRFLNDPFASAPGARMYRSGDLARWLVDGSLEYLGRNDEQVKIRGFRIELGEIEAQLSACEGVRDAVVLVREDEPGDKRLVAYVIGTPGVELDAAQLRDQLRLALADYMLPSAFVSLQALPLTANGKLDRKALPVPAAEAYARRQYEAPQGPVETTLAALWVELLGVEQVGRHDQFFELGGHSMLAVKLIERMRQVGLSTDVGVLFGQPTLAALAAASGNGAEVQVPVNLIPAGCRHITPDMLPLARLTQAQIDRVVNAVPGCASNVQDIYGLVPLQEGILYHHLASDEGDPYLLQALLRVDSFEQLLDFTEALQQVIDRHDILRTAVAWEGLDEPVQVVWREARLRIEAFLPHPDQGDIAAQLQAHFDPRRVRLDLQRAPMMRLHYAEDAANQGWVAVLLFHHLIDDATSLALLGAEIEAFSQGRGARLPASVPYRNHVAQARLGVSREEHQAFFREMLADVDEPTLPFGLQDVQGDGSGVDEALLPVDPDLARRLRGHARRLGVSNASLHHLAWAQVVGRLSGRQDVVFGTVLMGRLHSGQGAERALGMFINTLPLRIAAGEQGIQAAVRTTHGRLAALLGHEHAPLSLAQACSGVAAPTPLFSALMNYRHVAVGAQAPQDAGQTRTWAGVQVLGGEERTNYPLSLSVDDLGDSFGLTVQAMAGIGAQRICGYMHTVLEQLADALDNQPDAPLHSLDWLPASERRRLLEDFNGFNSVYPKDLLLHQMFESQAALQPDAVAVTYEGQRLSYAELNQWANQIAHRLIADGIGADDRVAICVERSLEMIAGLVGILKAGAGYVPLDPSYPAERLAYMLEDSAPKMLLTQRALRERFPQAAMPVLLLEADARAESGIDRAPSFNPQNAALNPQHLAYLIYTSGSTGQPKGVAMPHAPLVNLMHWQIAETIAHRRPGQRTLQFAALGFDVAFQEVFSTLCAGGELSLIHGDIRLDFRRLFQHICEQRIERLYMPCIALQALAEAMVGESEAQAEQPECLLQDVITAGEQLRITEPMRRFFARLDDARLHNHYGPTESHVVTTLTLNGDPQAWPTLPSIGRPVANTRIYLLDEHMRPVPVGVAGELYIGGVCVARGYLNRDDLTAERFIADPFAADDIQGARLYKTGDLGCWQADGTIDYLGRNDDQIKIRGFRIELGEIEARLGQYPGLRHTAVLAREDRPGEKRLVAYFSVQAGQAVPEADQMRLHLQALLPDYMIPAAYVHLAKLPVSPNGKLDRRALPEPSADAFVSRDYQAPLGDTETTLAALWCEVLGVERVGRQDHFFELGGHSLLAVKLIECMRQVGLSADVRVLFGQPTLAALAAAVGGGIEIVVPANGIPDGCERITPDMLTLTALDPASIERIVAGVPGGAANVQDIYPLAPLQEGILYHHIAAEQGDPYLLQATFALQDPAHIRRFAEGLQAMISRHDILRTALVWQGLEQPLQVVLRQVELPMEQITLAPADGDILGQLQRRFDPRECRLDLTQAPLMHLAFAQDSANQRWVAILLFHHIALDHTALDVMSEEMLAHVQGTVAQLPAAMPYRNYVGQARLGVSREQHEGFFRDMLGDVDEPTLPFGLLEVQGDGQGIKEVRHDLPAELCQRLRTQARQLGVSAASLHHLAWARVLGSLSGREDVVFGTVLLGRMQSGLGADRALGMFINTLPLRVDVGTCSVRQAVRQTHARLTALLGHEHAPLVLAQRCSAVPAASPLFSALLNYRHSPAREASGGEYWADTQVLGVRERTNYPCTLSVDDQGEGFLLSVQVAGGFDGQRVCGYMQTVLTHLVAALESAPDLAVRDLPVLPRAERQQLLQDFNATTTDDPMTGTVHGLFEGQVRLRPHATAAVHRDQSLSYEQLNQRANQLAAYLLDLGVRPAARVAILLERSLDLLAAQLAVLKCAAVYVPLDTKAPLERKQFMLEDSQAEVLLTLGDFPLDSGTAIRVDLERVALHALPTDDPQLPQSSESPAHILYTSGSTGMPKGVLVPHRGISRLVIDNGYADFNDQDRIAFIANPAFDASTLDVWGALLNGGQVLVVDHETLLEPKRLAQLLVSARATVMLATTAVFNQYVQLIPEAINGLRILLTGGERGDPTAFRRLLALAPDVRVVHCYGPTESTVVAAALEVTAVAEDADSVSIGRPIGNTQVYILDARQQLVPLGVSGEICIGGKGVALGYLNRADLNAEKFITDPFSDEPGRLLYRTGDLGHWLPDGLLECLGRNDDQVKIRGFRIELGEIEARLGTHPQVGECAVLAREDVPGDKRLVAYVTISGERVSVDALRSYLQGLLPEYMVPSAYVQMAALPITLNGKLDRKALPAPDIDALVHGDYQAPQGEVETLLASIWADVLKVEQVGRYDHFFELGGHSLLAVTLIERMRQVGLSADVRVLFSQPTLAALAAAVGRGTEVVVPANLIPARCEHITPDLLPLISMTQVHIDHVLTSVPGGAANVQDIYPLAPLQAGILYHHISAGQGDPYTLKALFGLRDRARLDDFSGALQSVINRHDILRTAVLWEGLDEPVQVVLRQAELQVTELFLDPADGPVAEQLHQRFDPQHHRLDVRQAPLMRIVFSHDPLNDRWLALLLFHHMVNDATSLHVVLHEIQAYLLGQGDALGETVPYRNYVAQARLGVSEAQHEAFFRDMLGDIDEPTLPFGLHDVQDGGRDIEEASVTLSAELNLRLRAQARQAGVSAASLMHLAWARVLGSVSGREHVVFGTVLLGRMQAGDGADRALGMFINTLPLRVDVGAKTVLEGLKATHGQLTALLGHEHAPLVLAQRCSGVAAPAPLFSALLNYRHTAVTEVTAEYQEAWQGIETFNAKESTNYPLTLNVDDVGDGFRLSVLVTAKVGAGRVCGYMQTALENLVDALEQSAATVLDSLPILPAAEREQLLVGFNDTAQEYPQQQTIHGMFEAQVERTPDALAVVHGEQRLSYRQLNEQANRLAHALRKQGVVPDSRVGICVERGAEMVVGLLAILKAGGGYVPLDPAYPVERIAYMLQDSAPAAVLAQSSTQGLLAGVAVPVINLDQNVWQDESVHNPEVAGLTSAHLAYLIYTSGSTGLPKGVMIEHRNTVNFLTWAHSAFDASTLSKTLFSTSLNFDLAVYECFAPLTSGGCIEVVKNVLELQHGEHDIGLINTVPSALKALLEVDGLPKSVHTVNVAGEALKRSLVETLFEKTGVQRLCNLYGPSETTTYSSWVAMDREQGFAAHIGKPVGNTQFYLLDEQQQPVPLGVPGEIYIGGAGVARGYLNRDDLTAERFLPDPFSASSTARMYRTGDLGRYLPDGNIEYLGRNDDQVKIRGFRIELGEIDARLAKHPAIHEAVVMAREDVPGDKRLVAYYTVRSAHTQPAIDSLRGWLLEQLPVYMVPVAYVHLDALPLTPNGKLDRKALPVPDAQAVVNRGYEAPQGDVETRLAMIWAEVLKVEQVGRHDHFFELGGHSLLAVSLIERMRQVGLSADVRVLFSQPTLAALAAAVGGGSEIKVPENAIPHHCTRITPDLLPLADLDQAAIDHIVASVPGGVSNVKDIYALAPLQEGILYHHLAAEHGDPYVLQTLFEMAGRERLNAFIDALQSVIDRHDILRTAVLWQGLEAPMQVVWRQARLFSEQIELDPADGPILDQLQQRFDPRHARLEMSQAPLMRLVFAEDLANQRWVAILLFHHMVLDHTAMEVVLHDMQAHLLGKADQLDVAMPYRNYVAQARLGVSREAHEGFFRELLADIDEPTLPFGLLDVQGDGRDIEESHLTLDRQLNLRLRAQARQLGVSAASLVHLAWAQVLGKVSSKRTVVFGTVLMGRMQSGEGADRALGMFINTLPLRVDLAGQGARDGVRATHARLTALLGHEHAPLVLAQRCSGVATPLPLFSSLLNYRHSSAAQQSDESVAAWQGIEVLSGEERTNYPLTLNVDDLGDGFRFSVLVTDKVGAGRVCGYMQTALENLVDALEQSPATTLDSLPILPAAEREQLLFGLNDTAQEYPRQQTIHGMFETQVQRTPDALAVVHGEQRLSYRQLNEQANRLAHALRKQGVVPDSRVGICVERGAEMVVGLLAILKAGGGYVPLDPAYPVERIAYMLQDSAPAAVLAQAATQDLLADVSVPVINLDHPGLWQNEPVQNPEIEGLNSAHLAYLIYTSGSTGLPKGVMIEHRNTVNFLTWAHSAFDASTLSKTLFSTSLNFDLAVYECFAPLTSGGCIDVVKSVLELQHGEHDIGLINTVPSALKALLEVDGLPQSVHTVNVAGEALKRSLVETLFEKTGVQRLCNLYGPSETTTYSSWVAMDRENGFAPHIGKPVGNTQFYLLDEQQQPAPLGVPGEIYIGGAGVARGYLNRDDLTAERFLNDPFSQDPTARMYRTGDLGRYLPDGNIEYLGRNDDQVKIRGFRIELGEIDARLARHPAVQEAVVMAREDVPGDKRLVAYYTLRSADAQPAIDSLRGWLLGQLPVYMVPVAYVRLDALPLTPNGKLDRKALPAPDDSALISRGYEAPQGDAETLIAQIWQALLGVAQVGRHDHFFELGGHSLLAVSLMERMRQEGLEADVKSLFEHPTLSEYAATTQRMEIVL
jgi:amino acid adenylation domain-containing protein